MPFLSPETISELYEQIANTSTHRYIAGYDEVSSTAFFVEVVVTSEGPRAVDWLFSGPMRADEVEAFAQQCAQAKHNLRQQREKANVQHISIN